MTTADDTIAYSHSTAANLARLFSWAMLACMTVFLVNNLLNNIGKFPGAGFSGSLSILQLAFYGVGVALAAVYVFKNSNTSLRFDSERISAINTFLIRAAFWAVVIVGLADMVISFMRVEGMLEAAFGTQMANDLGRAQWRGLYIHLPLMALALVIACFTKTLGFPWLALLVVVAELLIVFTRFIFSYEQSFMADLVRFWYGALFLFSSAYTLLEEGHVRVDVFYAGFKDKTKGLVNAVGTLLLGMTLCWTILIVGMGSKAAIINSPVFNFEVTQAGFGMYVKYLMAAFLGIFAISMMIQFASYFLAAIADYRGDPGKRVPNTTSAH